MTKEHLAKYKKEGWVHIKNVIPSNLMDVVHKASQPLKEISLQNLWTPAPYGNKLHWLGMSCSASYDNTLWQCYKSNINRKIATTLLETEKIYLYNDQVVLKLSKENFNFKEHYDNQFTNNKDNKIHTINLSWILDDFTEENGTLSIKGKAIYPNKGDIIAIRGDTMHSSKNNLSDKRRLLYACVFTADKPVIFENFYKEEWICSTP